MSSEASRGSEAVEFTTTFVADRKTIVVERRVNKRGKFLRITESVNGRMDMICIPLVGREALIQALRDCA